MDVKVDYYAYLELTKEASMEDIKTAYKTLALKHHPDKGGNEERFKQISVAYEILYNYHKRREYDNKREGMGGFPQGFPFPFPLFRGGGFPQGHFPQGHFPQGQQIHVVFRR